MSKRNLMLNNVILSTCQKINVNDTFLPFPDDIIIEILKINMNNIKTFGLTCHYYYYQLFNKTFWFHEFKIKQLTLLGTIPVTLKEWVNQYNNLIDIRQKTNKMLTYMDQKRKETETEEGMLMTFEKNDPVEILLGEQIVTIKKSVYNHLIFFQTIVINLTKNEFTYYLGGIAQVYVIDNVSYNDFFYKLFYYYPFITIENFNKLVIVY